MKMKMKIQVSSGRFSGQNLKKSRNIYFKIHFSIIFNSLHDTEVQKLDNKIYYQFKISFFFVIYIIIIQAF
jgi:hypothetical protein